MYYCKAENNTPSPHIQIVLFTMKEELLYNIWRYKLFNAHTLTTIAGEPIDILFVGNRNNDSGPDFAHARIKIGKTEWVGHVEMHLKTSDWQMHGHQHDKAYNNVILHVVYEHDKDLNDALPVLQLKEYISAHTISNYLNIVENKNPVHCYKLLPYVDHFTWLHWMERMTTERLQHKVAALEDVLKRNKNHWEETFYQMLANYMGGKVNNENMAQLAVYVPLKILAKHKHNLIELEALLYGAAGLLHEQIDDPYYASLKSEYQFLKSKYQLKEMSPAVWKFMRMRPANFPTIRIAQLAMLIYQSSHLLSKIIETNNIKTLIKFFDVSPSIYWETHYRLGETSAPRQKKLGKSTVEALVINTIVPVVFHYGRVHQLPDVEQKAVEWLHALPAEKNNIVEQWSDLGKKAHNAADSQAQLHLYKQYCSKILCLNCAIGINLLREPMA